MRVKEKDGIHIRNRSGGRFDWFISCGGRVRWGSLAEMRHTAGHVATYARLPDRGQYYRDDGGYAHEKPVGL